MPGTYSDGTQAHWQKTVGYSQMGFLVRMAMSVLVFLAGLAFLVVSGFELLFGNLQPERILGPGVSFVAALGTVLLLIYTGPLKEIRQSMVDLGATWPKRRTSSFRRPRRPRWGGAPPPTRLTGASMPGAGRPV